MRTFHYLDEKLTRSFLASLNGYVTGQETVRNRKQRRRRRKSGLNAGPLEFSRGKAEIDENEASGVREIPSEAQYTTLLDRISDEDQVVRPDTQKADSWSEVRRNVFVEAYGTVRISPIDSIADAGERMGDLLEVLEFSTGEQIASGVDRKMLKGMRRFHSLVGSSGIPLIIELPPDGNHQFFMRLNKRWLRTAISDFPDEVTVSGKVQRVLTGTDRVNTLDLTDRLRRIPMPPEKREELAEMDEKMAAVSPVVVAPAAVITPVAIFE